MGRNQNNYNSKREYLFSFLSLTLSNVGAERGRADGGVRATAVSEGGLLDHPGRRRGTGE